MIQIRDEGNTGGRPPRDPRVQEYATRALWGQLLSQDRFGYAGDDEDPRPLPKRTLASFKRNISNYFQADAREQRVRAPHALYWAFSCDRFRMAAEDAITVSREDLWWLAAPDDLVLISDGITPHYTTVHRVAREAGRIYFLDDWPGSIFLLEDRNSAGVRAEITPYLAGILDDILPDRREVSITREEFQKVIVGSITQDTPVLLEHYLTLRPQARESFPFLLSAGLALLDVEQDSVARFAVPYLERACALAGGAGGREEERRAAAPLYLALVTSARRARAHGDPLAEKPFEDSLAALVARHGEAPLLGGLSLEQLCRLGNAAAWGEEFTAAARYLEVALSREPAHEGALWLRSKVRLRLSDAAGALADATEAVAANERRSSELTAQRDARDPRDWIGRMDDERRLGGLRERRADIHAMRATALLGLEKGEEARADALQVIECAPQAAIGYRLLGLVEHAAGNRAAACQQLRQALSRAEGAAERGRTAQLLALWEAESTGRTEGGAA